MEYNKVRYFACVDISLKGEKVEASGPVEVSQDFFRYMVSRYYEGSYYTADCSFLLFTCKKGHDDLAPFMYMVVA